MESSVLRKITQITSCCNYQSLHGMEIAAVFYFLNSGAKLHFYSLGTICEENMQVSRGAQPLWLWVSNRGEQHPCWHTIFRRKV